MDFDNEMCILIWNSPYFIAIAIIRIIARTHFFSNSLPKMASNICSQCLIFDDEIIGKNPLSFRFRARTFHVLSKMVNAINDNGLTDVHSTIFNIET